MEISAKWRTISLPAELLEQVKEYTKTAPEYTSMSDFVTKATAEKLRVERQTTRSITKIKRALNENQKCQLETWAEPFGDRILEMDYEELIDKLTEHFQGDWTLEEVTAGAEHLMEWVRSLKKN